MPDHLPPNSSAELVYAHRVLTAPGVRRQGTLHDWVVGLTLAGGCLHSAGKGATIADGPGDWIIIRPHVAQSFIVPVSKEAWARHYDARAVDVLGFPVDAPRRSPAPSTDGWDNTFVIFRPRPHWLPWLSYAETIPGHSLLHLDGATLRRARRWLLAVVRHFMSGAPNAGDLAMSALEQVLLHVRSAQDRSLSTFDSRLERAINHIDRHLSRAISLDELARIALCSPTRLSQLFRRHVGTAPSRYLNLQRMERAARLLRSTPLSIKEVALRVGYDDPKYFMNCFRRWSGQTARAYRLNVPAGRDGP